MKFGGSSVGSVNSILSVKKIVEAVGEPVIVVVSALGGITDKLITTSQMAADGNAAYEKQYREIVNRHIEMVYTVIPASEKRTELLDKVNELLSELKNIFQGIYLIRDLSPKTSAIPAPKKVAPKTITSYSILSPFQNTLYFDYNHNTAENLPIICIIISFSCS